MLAFGAGDELVRPRELVTLQQRCAFKPADSPTEGVENSGSGFSPRAD